ncbi:hypothetical protein Tco_1539619 [Tanacetum coccineum]
MAHPPREQRHRFLRYEGLEYTDLDIADFESRLERIYTREIHRVQVMDFQGMLELLRDGLFARMVMEHYDEAVSVRWSQEAPELESESGRMILGNGDLHDYWRDISTDGDFLGPPLSYTLIKDLVLRLCYRMMAHSIAGMSQAPENVTVTDLFYLRGLDVRLVNIPYLLARYLRRFSAGRKSGVHISGGQFVGRLAQHFRLQTAEILGGLTVIAPVLLMIDMVELVRLQICVQLDDTWVWVAMRPERQPDATAGAPVVAEDAPSVDEGDQAVLAPVQAPQQPPSPPPAPARTIYFSVRMTKVIKGEFEKIKDVKVEDVLLICDASLEVFNDEVSRLSKIDDDLFTYEVKIDNIPCDSKMDNDSEQEADDDIGYDPSDVAFIEWLRSKFFNYKTMDHYTMKALWIYWIRGDDEVELTDEESSDNDDEIAEVFRIDTNIFDYETPLCSAFNEFNYLLKVDPDLLTKDIIGFKTYEDYKDDWIYEWNKDVPWVDEKPWTDAGIWTKPTPVKHTCKPFNYKTGCSEWPTCGWKGDGYCNGGNLPGAYIIGNQLHYQDYEWYEALEDCKLKDEALRNKAIMEGSIKEDDESCYEQKRQWNTYTNYDDAYEINHEHNKSEELCEIQEQPVCNIRRYMMIKYSFNDDEEYVAVKEDEYDDLTVTRKEACRAYQEIF